MYALSKGKNNLSTSRQIVNCAAQGDGDHRGLSLSTLHMSIWFTEVYIPSAAKKKKNSRLSV